MEPSELMLTLECSVPDEVRIGTGTALFLCGWCFHPRAAIRALSFVVDDVEQPVMAHGMPRLDPLRALHPQIEPSTITAGARDPDASQDPEFRSYASGFWGLVRLAPRPGGRLTIGLRARLADGGVASAELVTTTIVEPPRPLALDWGSQVAAQPRIAICMATYDPPADLLADQLDSIRAQTHRNWRCVISDDCSSARGTETLMRLIDGDERFVVSRSPRRQGFYRNFERALSLVGPDAELVALADQDDRWDPDKLATLAAALGDAQLVYSDARLVSRAGQPIADSWWGARRNNHNDLLSVLVANSVTGAASLLRRELLDDALPFPPAQFAHFHDHWLGLVALARGAIDYVDRPLYDYVQHGEASLGHAAANQMTSLTQRLRQRRPLRERVGLWRLHYFVDVCRLAQFATVLLIRCGERMDPAKRRELESFVAAERNPAAIARLVVRGARELVGRPETLGAEWMLAHALIWRRLVGASARDRPQSRFRLDALPPPTLIMEPGRRQRPPPAQAIADKIEPLRFRVSERAPARVNLLIPTIDLRHFFGGYIGKFNLAARLQQAGERVRIVTVDPVGPLPPDWRRTVEGFSGLDGLLDRVEVAFGREADELEVSERDAFIATTWWTAHIAHDAAARLQTGRFVYLIQEYEPFTFAMGTYAALAEQSYRFPHFGLFSSELLRDYFRHHRIGVFADDIARGDRDSASFENAITAVAPPTVAELDRPGPRRLLFYARPEPHAARNMYELGVLALSQALALGAFADGWELHGIGTVQRARTVELGAGARMTLLERSDQAAYGELLRAHDVGLALMYTPHPSLVPIEMASAGMLTVTNTFENKTAEKLAAISGNLIAPEPTVDALATALVDAGAAAGDLRRRVAGSETRWSRDWNDSFYDELVARVIEALRGGR